MKIFSSKEATRVVKNRMEKQLVLTYLFSGEFLKRNFKRRDFIIKWLRSAVITTFSESYAYTAISLK